MRSEKLLGSQVPRIRICPDYVRSDGDDAKKILRAGKFELDEWQSDRLTEWLGRDSSGRWAAPTCGGSVPRQNGKTYLIVGRIASGMLLFNESVIYTAHIQKTATETFEALRDLFETPAFRKYVGVIKTALGREEIRLRSGARVKFLARTRNGGRGQHCDLLVIDEAQEIDDNAQASFLPALSASLNPQTIYIGTPPDPTMPQMVYRNIRQNAIDGKTKKTAWFEFSVDKIGDVHDPTSWAATNPAFGKRILYSTVESELEQMDERTFARERLGWWEKMQVGAEMVIDPVKWKECASDDPKPNGKTAYGIKFSPDATTVCLAGAVIPKEGKARISVIEIKPTAIGIQWLADWLNERYHNASCVVIDGKNGVDLLVDKISKTWRMKGSVIRAGPRDVIAAASMLTNEVNEETITWFKKQDLLNNSATTSTKRKIGTGFGFGGENSSPIEACALALWGARNSKRDPNRKMRVG